VALLFSFRGISVTPSERYFLSTRQSNLVFVLAFLLFDIPHFCANISGIERSQRFSAIFRASKQRAATPHQSEDSGPTKSRYPHLFVQ
jgi:hypothetical protein